MTVARPAQGRNPGRGERRETLIHGVSVCIFWTRTKSLWFCGLRWGCGKRETHGEGFWGPMRLPMRLPGVGAVVCMSSLLNRRRSAGVGPGKKKDRKDGLRLGIPVGRDLPPR